MQYILSVFASRRDAMALYDLCLANRVSATIVNTPRELGASCGISVRTEWRTQNRVRQAAMRLPTYVGTYLVNNTLTHHTMVRL